MTTIEAIRNYFLTCPLLGDGCFNVDYIPQDLGFSIDSIPSDPIVKKYVDGGALKQYKFTFSSREAWGNDTLENISNNGFYEDLSKWIENNNKQGILPTLSTGQEPYKIELLSYGYLLSNTEDSAIYQIQARLIYIE